MPRSRPEKKSQTPAPIGNEALYEATRQYLRRVLEDAEWIGDELEHCRSPYYRPPDAVLADQYCKKIRWQLRPTVQADGQIGVGQVEGVYKVIRLGRGQQGLGFQAGEKIDMDALAGYGVEPISLLSMLSRSGLGENFPRATNWLWRLLEALPADLWRSGKPPAESIVRDWPKATEMLRGCLERMPAGTTPDVKADLASGGKRTGGGKGAGNPGKSAAILASVSPQLRRKRKKRPGSVDGEVLTMCRRRCCLCFGLKGDVSEKPGQIAHLDNDPSNNDKGNLAYLCLEHHDKYDTRTSQSKGLTIEEVRRYCNKLYRYLETHLGD